jgi:hypothetical protein
MEDESASRADLSGAAATAAVLHWMEGRPEGSGDMPAVAVLGRDPLHDLVTALWRASLECPFDHATMERLLWASVRHGEARRRQGWTEDALLDEYRLLRKLLETRAPGPENAFDRPTVAGERVQAGITLCVGGAIRGFNRESLAAAGDWPHVVQRFLLAFRPPGQRRRDLTT